VIEGGGRSPEAALERALLEVGARLDYPDSGNVWVEVGRRLRAAPAPSRSVARGRPRLDRVRGPSVVLRRPAWNVGIAVAAVVAVLAGVLVASPAARSAVADWLGLRGVRIFQGTSPLSPGTFSVFRLGERVSLEEAQRRVPYRILTPRDLEGAEVYLGRQFRDGQVSLVYRAAPGLPAASETGAAVLLSQFVGDVDSARLEKAVQWEGTTLRAVTVNGHRGFWIAGEPHLVYYLDEAGTPVADTVRLAGNVLLWEQGKLTVRLESALPLDGALELAATIE
jgi:hypothetical protein